MKKLQIALVEPFFGGSHKSWAEGLATHSHHDFTFYTLKDSNWKWRMYAGAIELANTVNLSDTKPDLFLVSDMLCLNTFVSLLDKKLRSVPCALYFHENQLDYPWSSQDKEKETKRDRHYAFTNYRSALAADSIAFNSNYHRSQFINSLEEFLHPFPDPNGIGNIKKIEGKSIVLYPGINRRLNDEINNGESNLILWNHRWEYDKNPEDFFKLCTELKGRGISFKLAVVGEQFSNTPKIFKQAKKEFKQEIIHWGFIKEKSDYYKMLSRSKIIPVTSNQDFFGISCVEAINYGVQPLLPNRLAFPEHIPVAYHQKYIYNDFQELVSKSIMLLNADKDELFPQKFIDKYLWNNLINEYDDFLFSSSLIN